MEKEFINDGVMTYISTKKKKDISNNANKKSTTTNRRDRFKHVISAFKDNSKERFSVYLLGNGFNDTLFENYEKNKKRKEKRSDRIHDNDDDDSDDENEIEFIKPRRKRCRNKYTFDQQKSIDEFLIFLREFSYDSTLFVNDSSSSSSSKGVGVGKVSRNHKKFSDRENMFTELEKGPKNYIPIIADSPAESKKERRRKDLIRQLYRHTKPEIYRAQEFGGVVEKRTDTTPCVSNLLFMNLANNVQRASLTADAHNGRPTLMQKDLYMSDIWDGLYPS
jgi:hypothetical protein